MKGRDLQFAEFLDVSVGNLGSLLLAKKKFVGKFMPSLVCLLQEFWYLALDMKGNLGSL